MATCAVPPPAPPGGEGSKWLHQPDFSGFTWWAYISKRLHHPCLLGVPKVGRDQNVYITAAFPGPLWWGEIQMATSPLPSWGLHGVETSIWLHHRCFLLAPMVAKTQPRKEWMWRRGAKQCENRWKWVKWGENPRTPYPQCGRSIKTHARAAMMPKASQVSCKATSP